MFLAVFHQIQQGQIYKKSSKLSLKYILRMSKYIFSLYMNKKASGKLLNTEKTILSWIKNQSSLEIEISKIPRLSMVKKQLMIQRRI